MADTQRESSDLLTSLFVDGQADGAITAGDIRDLIVSLLTPFGSIGFAGNATETTISVSGTFYVVAGTYVAGGSPRGFTESTGGVLTYTAAPDRHSHIVSNLDMTAASSNQEVSFQWHKNGSPIGYPVTRKVGTGTDVGALSVHADAMLSTNDYLDLRVTNLTTASNVTVGNCYCYIMGMTN